MATEDSTPPRPNAQAMITALKTERAGYESRGMTDRVAAVDKEIKHWTEVAKNAPKDPDGAGEVRASDAAVNAEKMIEALKAEKAGLEGRDGKEKRVADIDEQIKHYTGVLRKESKPASADGAQPASAAGQQRRNAGA